MEINKGIAFFGATGGCAGACLARCLEAGYTCSALVRNPQKLIDLLATHDISPETISSHLTVITGNVKDPINVSQTILPTTAIIVSGIGVSPVWKQGGWFPILDDWTICQDGVSTILDVLRLRRNADLKPLLVIISTTGISKFGRDIPLPMVPLYHYMLSVPHKDKEAMELIIVDAMNNEKGNDAIMGGYVIVRPSLLTNGPVCEGAVRADVEDGDVAKNAIGYTISRKDVGGYIFEEVVQKYTTPNGTGRIVAITY
ncbi:hypothetical protein V496_01245 [Pseudogymnoascus sp. VKM F-4515 (FW-2607)]|nr:hypothetical protein V496_01245 [Pseudogymnoascus sp. VKM F-4515 (FW-2607)]